MHNPVIDILNDVYEQCRPDTAGAVADYIPELSRVDPDSFGICLATTDGFVYEIGNVGTEFTIQSISKPFTYGLALADRGVAAVAARIDVEPSGEPFNEISLDPDTERPRNPMINAGAIAAAGLVVGDSAEHRFERVRQCYSRYAGRQLAVDEAVYSSEAVTGHRNRAIGHMLRSFGVVDDADAAVDLYFRQCSLIVTGRDLAAMAVTLANNGRHPLTGELALAPELVERVLSVMTTCGMYDAAGAWVTSVGLPAKSGVGGGVLAVLPGQLGIAVHSPRLDEHGNSVRGVQACGELSRRLELHFLHVPRAARSSIRSSYTVVDAPSRQRRSPAEVEVLQRYGNRARTYDLHGDLLFAGAETAVRAISAQAGELDVVVVNATRVDEVSTVAVDLFAALSRELTRLGRRSALVDPDGAFGDTGRGDTMLGDTASFDESAPAGERPVFVSADAAARWCEEILLDRYCADGRTPASVTLAQHPLVQAIPAAHRAGFVAEFELRSAAADDVLVRRGDRRAGLVLILQGKVGLTLPTDAGAGYPMTTLPAGTSFGELALLTDGAAFGDVRAETEVRLAVLPADRFELIAAATPAVALALVRRLAVDAQEQLEVTVRAAGVRAGGVTVTGRSASERTGPATTATEGAP
ncbi:glutaminase A [Skermania piniformis]|uniref:Glutaminase n=1 Tax=Skermania pinensis TaxID=39122 RepID=A0ABX8SD82_9ACTN|nr:glutaminase A [Skermania piniformis]QXQ15386.1 glutaminase A [Skermania piniformis]